MSEWDGKVAFITGASKGIGRAIAEIFAAKGITVICASRTVADLETLVKNIEENGGKASLIRLDVSNTKDFQEAVKEVADNFGSIDILINNAGITRDKLILRMSVEDWDTVQAVNLKGCFNGIKAVTPFMMRARFGRIINITSVVGITGNAGQSNYAASKAGIIGLTKSAAKELASRNICVNAIAPGYIETEMTAKLTESVREKLLKQIPIGKIGQPEDVAQVALFLASDKAGYITGEVISVNGGLHT
ncbi:MAG: 3-oxoacyl-[acyl-carrier-protein] reductase [Fidelibacterota bacterium]